MSSEDRGVSRSRRRGGLGGGEAEREGGRPGVRLTCLSAFAVVEGDASALRLPFAVLEVLRAVFDVIAFELEFELLFEVEVDAAGIAAEVEGVGSSAVELLVPRNLALLRVERAIEEERRRVDDERDGVDGGVVQDLARSLEVVCSAWQLDLNV